MINEIHRLAIMKKSTRFNYFWLLNNFIIRNRITMALCSLSLTSLVMVRKAATIALSNFLAFNHSERSRDHITKTQYSKVMKVVEKEKYHSNLIINNRVSNYLKTKWNKDFSVLICPTERDSTLNHE